MSEGELQQQIQAVTNLCGDSREQQAVKSVLCALLGAMYAGQQVEMMLHCADFAQAMIHRLTASRN